MNNSVVRKATPDDAYWVAFVNVHTWLSTYKWLVPDILLENRIKHLDERVNKTCEKIKNGDNYLVAENVEKKQIIWMLIYWPSRNPEHPNSWEINAIYVLPEYQKLGIGKKLFIAWITELGKLWYKDMIINVLKWNNAINFYKKYWWKVVWERYDEVGKFKLHEDILYFKNIESIR